MSDELKPCPFCGGTKLVSYPVWEDRFRHVVDCQGCGTRVKSALWNTRPIEDQLRARIKELEEAMPEPEALRFMAGPIETPWKSCATQLRDMADRIEKVMKSD